MNKIKYLVLILPFIFSACSDKLIRVASYEKENFSKDRMLFSPLEVRDEFEGHLFGIRESAVGGESSFTGGCGCK